MSSPHYAYKTIEVQRGPPAAPCSSLFETFYLTTVGVSKFLCSRIHLITTSDSRLIGTYGVVGDYSSPPTTIRNSLSFGFAATSSASTRGQIFRSFSFLNKVIPWRQRELLDRYVICRHGSSSGEFLHLDRQSSEPDTNPAPDFWALSGFSHRDFSNDFLLTVNLHQRLLRLQKKKKRTDAVSDLLPLFSTGA
ncbi:unnamed protein product [Cochlearia groenlandica]